MPSSNEKLGRALSNLKNAQINGVVRHNALLRRDRELLISAGFLSKIIRGWYYNSNPAITQGETSWLAFYWEFVQQYLLSARGDDYCLSPESSLLVHSRSTTIPTQLIVVSKTGGTLTLDLPGQIKILIYKDTVGFPKNTNRVMGLNVMSSALALTRTQESYFRANVVDVALLLKQFNDSSPILRILLEGGKSTVAGRLAGAFRANGQSDIANQIMSAMKSAGFDVRETDPFEYEIPSISFTSHISPYQQRIELVWKSMRDDVGEIWSSEPRSVIKGDELSHAINDIYKSDAYNSLSIEGYRVNEELILRVQSGEWNPANSRSDAVSADALAAHGYFLAFESVKRTIQEIVDMGELSIMRSHYRNWYLSLFSPAVQAGILAPTDLAGFRNHQVYISGSMHIPPPFDAVPGIMDTLFDLIESESNPAVRAVLGHFIFVFIHPYGDGNGRLGRFLMNTLLCSTGFAWTVIRLQRRADYMSALEQASAKSNIRPFAVFVLEEMRAGKVNSPDQ